MPSESNGGIWALGGYLYQTIGILGISAQISLMEKDSSLTEGGDLEVLINLMDVNKALQVESEAFDQDALVHTCLDPKDEGVFVQFKYSTQIPPPTLGPEEVKKIIQAFDDSVSRAEGSGTHVTSCILITNRRFAEGKDSGGQYWQDKKNDPHRTYQIKDKVGIPPELVRDNLKQAHPAVF